MTPITISPDDWVGAGFFFTEAARGGPLAWRVGDRGLLGDPLGPVRHIHEQAAEYYYMFQGAAIVEVNGEERVLHENELAYIPPDLPHNFLGLASDLDALLFVLVGPNFPDRKWRTDDDNKEHVETQVHLEVASVFSGNVLPRGGTLSAEELILSAGDDLGAIETRQREVVYLIVDGDLQFQVHRHPTGTLQKGMHLYVREGLTHRVSSSSGCKALKFSCQFVPWRGVPLRGGSRV